MNDDKLSSGRLVWLPNRLGGALWKWNCDTHDWYHESVAPSFQQEAFACLPGLVEDLARLHLLTSTRNFPRMAFASTRDTKKRSAPRDFFLEREVMMTRYVLRAPVQAVLDKPGGQQVSVTLPAGAVLHNSSRPSTTLLGMIDVYWEGRPYSVSHKNLLKHADHVSTGGRIIR